MAANFLKITFRGLWKNKGYSFLNIFGLAIGIACAGLIFLWVEDEVGYDAWLVKRDRLYYIEENQVYEGKTRTLMSTPAPMAPAIQQEIPGIAAVSRVGAMSTSPLSGCWVCLLWREARPTPFMM